MKEIEKLITPLIDSQFPGFYQEEGPLFVLFLKEYFVFKALNSFVRGTYSFDKHLNWFSNVVKSDQVPTKEC